MRSLQFLGPGRLAWRDAEVPRLQAPIEALVRPIAVARCDLDVGLLRGEAPFRGRVLHWLRENLPESIGQRRLFRNAPFKGPYAFGHECVAEVVEVGAEVRTVNVGMRVVVPFQISCGMCVRCARGETATCEGVPPRSMYGFGTLGGIGWGGALSDFLRVPFADAMLVPIPPGADPVGLAAAGDNIVDGWRTVAKPLLAEPGAPVLVVGGMASSVGLYAAGIAVALGAQRVDYWDHDDARLRIAARFGAHPIERPYTAPLATRYPITVDASAEPDGLALALRATDSGGTCTSVGIYYADRTLIPLRDMYGSGVTFITGRAHVRTGIPAILDLVVSGRFRPELAVTRTSEWADAPAALLHPGPKVVIVRD